MQHLQSISRALIVEYRVISALMLREIHTIYGNSSLGYLWVVIQNIFGIGVFWAMRELMNAPSPHGMAVSQFLIVGFCLWSIISGIFSKCLNAVSANMALLTFPQVTELDVMIARALVLWFTQVIVAILLLFLSSIIDSTIDIYSLGGVYISLLLSPLLGLGLGLTFSSLSVLIPSIERIVPFVLRVLFFVSGVFFSADTFSQEIAEVLLYNPIFQIIELSRSSIFYGYPANGCNWNYPIACTLIFLSLGLLLERYVRSRRKE